MLKKISTFKSFLFFSVIAIALGYLKQFAIITSIAILHELSHIIAAKAFGLNTEKISFTPIGLFAVVEDFDFLPLFKKVVVLLAGPFANLLLAMLSLLFFKGKYEFFVAANISLFFFNLLPIYPLDGGSVFSAILGRMIGTIKAGNLITKISKIFCYILIVIGFVQVVLYPYNISILCISLYLIFINKNGNINAQMQFCRLLSFKDKEHKEKRILPLKSFAVFKEAQVKNIVKLLCFDYFFVVYIIDEGVVFTERQVIDYVLKFGLCGTVFDIYKTANAAC